MRAWLLLIAWLALPACMSGARGAEVIFSEPSALIHAAGKVTYLDLLRQIVPDLAKTETGFAGTRMIELRHVGGFSAIGEPPHRPILGTLSAVELDGGRRVLVLASLGGREFAVEQVAALALFSLDGEPRLLDAVDVGLDMRTSFGDHAVQELGVDRLVLTRSSHFNSSQGYMTTVMLLLGADRIELIDTVFTFDDRACAFERRQDFSAAVDDIGGARPAIVVKVVESTVPTGEHCGDDPPAAPSTREISVIYRWDEEKRSYLPGSDALARLAEENEKRF